MNHSERKACLFILILIILFSSCQHRHDFEPANCIEPEICRDCGESNGFPLGHEWEDATCEEPRTCRACWETEGDPLWHDWEDATYLNPKTCSRCYETEGNPLSTAGLPEYSYVVYCSIGDFGDWINYEKWDYSIAFNSVGIDNDNETLVTQCSENVIFTLTATNSQSKISVTRTFSIESMTVGDNVFIEGTLDGDEGSEDYYIVYSFDITRIK